MFQAGRDWQVMIGFFAALCSAASCLAFQIRNFLFLLIMFLQDRVEDSLKTRKDFLLVFLSVFPGPASSPYQLLTVGDFSTFFLKKSAFYVFLLLYGHTAYW